MINRNKFSRLIVKILVGSGFLIMVMSVPASGQDSIDVVSVSDSLSLNEIMKEVLQNHPVIKKAGESIKQADARIGIAKSGYLPTVDASATVSHIGPVPELSIPDFGTFQLYPENNFNTGINVRQNIYDFGKTSSKISLADANKEMQLSTLEETKQKMAITVIMNYYSLAYLQQAIKIKDLQLETLAEHLDFVKKKKETGSGTDYEILNTKVKISVTENQKLDLLAGRKKQLAILNSLLGQPAKTEHRVKDLNIVVKPEIKEDSLLSFALNHRNDLLIARKNIEMAQIHLNIVKSESSPSINFLANGGWKNGYVPDLNEIKANYIASLSLHVPIFDGTRQKYNIVMAKSSIEALTLESDLLQRNISSEVIENEINIQTAYKKVNQTRLQLSQAEEAYKLARINYSAGAITNLELLDISTTVSESKLMVVKSEINYILSVYKLKESLGGTWY